MRPTSRENQLPFQKMIGLWSKFDANLRHCSQYEETSPSNEVDDIPMDGYPMAAADHPHHDDNGPGLQTGETSYHTRFGRTFKPTLKQDFEYY